MPRNADARQNSRRSRSANWLPGGLIIAVACAVGFYFVQNPAAVEQVRNALGFGRPNAPQEQAEESAEVAEIDPIEAMEIPRFEEREEASEGIAAFDNDESSATSFLPVRRVPRRSARELQISDRESVSNLQLDQRFERDLSEETAGPVRTAELVESAEESSEETISRPSSRRDLSKLDSSNPVEQPPQGKIRRAPTSTSTSVHLTAGDDIDAPPAPRRPGRPLAKATPTASNSGVKALDLNAVRGLIDDGQDSEAYRQLSEAYFQFPSQRPTFQQQLDEVSQRIYFSSQTQIQPPYEIQPGDQLRKIANKYQLSWQYLSRLNQVDARKIRPGKLLKVFQGPFEAKVDLSDFELTVLLNGQYVKRYQVGIGKTNTTPIGEFTVREKLENPTYYGPNGMVLEPDDPENPLGERWIDIGNSFGIHGTIEPDSIGKSESAGCIRMRNEDVAEVYDLLIIGSQVRIQR